MHLRKASSTNSLFSGGFKEGGKARARLDSAIFRNRVTEFSFGERLSDFPDQNGGSDNKNYVL